MKMQEYKIRRGKLEMSRFYLPMYLLYPYRFSNDMEKRKRFCFQGTYLDSIVVVWFEMNLFTWKLGELKFFCPERRKRKDNCTAKT